MAQFNWHLFLRRIRRRKNPCLALQGCWTFTFAWTHLFPTAAQPTKTKKNAAWSYLLHYACSVFCFDRPKSSLHSFSLLLFLLRLTAIPPIRVCLSSECYQAWCQCHHRECQQCPDAAPGSHAGYLTPGSLTRGLKHNPLNMCSHRGLFGMESQIIQLTSTRSLNWSQIFLQ